MSQERNITSLQIAEKETVQNQSFEFEISGELKQQGSEIVVFLNKLITSGISSKYLEEAYFDWLAGKPNPERRYNLSFIKTDPDEGEFSLPTYMNSEVPDGFYLNLDLSNMAALYQISKKRGVVSFNVIETKPKFVVYARSPEKEIFV